MAEEKKIAIGYIGNALRSSAADHTTTFADEVFDTERQKYQSEVNTDLETKIAEEKAAIMGTDRIADGAVTTEKLADSAMSQAMSTAISNEAQARAAADEHLNTAIEAEKNRAEAAETANAQVVSYKENANRILITNTGTDIVIDGKKPSNLVVNSDCAFTILGRNRFDIDSALFSFNSYSSYHIITKENGGIKINKSTLPQNYSIHASTEYIAEIAGELFVSCEAEVEGDISNLAMIVKVNDVSQTLVYGRGLLYESVNVKKGDIIRLCFYSNINGNSDGVLYYKNIMIAYGGLYPYLPYIPPIYNSKYDTYSLPLVKEAYENATTAPESQMKYRHLLNASYFVVPEDLRPSNNDEIADISVNGLSLVTYNETYNQKPGVGVNYRDGRLSVYVDGEGTIPFVEWLTDNPVSVRYSTCKVDTNFYHNYQRGEILISNSSLSVTYECDTDKKKLNCVCFGDSITGMYANKVDYPTMIEMESDIHCINVGFAGCKWTDHKDSRYNAFSMNRLTDAIINDDWTIQDEAALSLGGLYTEHLSNLKSIDFRTIDFVTIFYGTNDWGDYAILESSDDSAITDKQRTNVEDAVKYTISNLLTKFPNLRIIIISPYWRSLSAEIVDSNVNPNGRGNYLYEFADKIAEYATLFNLPTLNLYRILGANTLTNRYYTSDGTHPTEWTKHSIAHRLISMIYENS